LRIGTDGHLKLADFGLSKVSAQINKTSWRNQSQKTINNSILNLSQEAYQKVQKFLPIKVDGANVLDADDGSAKGDGGSTNGGAGDESQHRTIKILLITMEDTKADATLLFIDLTVEIVVTDYDIEFDAILEGGYTAICVDGDYYEEDSVEFVSHFLSPLLLGKPVLLVAAKEELRMQGLQHGATAASSRSLEELTEDTFKFLLKLEAWGLLLGDAAVGSEVEGGGDNVTAGMGAGAETVVGSRSPRKLGEIEKLGQAVGGRQQLRYRLDLMEYQNDMKLLEQEAAGAGGGASLPAGTMFGNALDLASKQGGAGGDAPFVVSAATKQNSMSRRNLKSGGLGGKSLNSRGGHRDSVAVESKDRSLVGTLHFIAPEAVTSRNYSKAVDWWAFGITIYECLVRRHLFTGEDKTEVFENILRAPIDLSPLLEKTGEPKVVDLVTSLLVRDPAARMGTQSIDALKAHPFFASVSWATVSTAKPAFLPGPFATRKYKVEDRELFYGPRGGADELSLRPDSVVDAHQQGEKMTVSSLRRSKFGSKSGLSRGSSSNNNSGGSKSKKSSDGAAGGGATAGGGGGGSGGLSGDGKKSNAGREKGGGARSPNSNRALTENMTDWKEAVGGPRDRSRSFKNSKSRSGSLELVREEEEDTVVQEQKEQK
jgi:serine/threonine protein kinase